MRHVIALACLVAFGALLWRLVGWWDELNGLGRVVTFLLAFIEFILAVGLARRAAIGGPFNEAAYVVLAHAVAVIVAMVAWPRLKALTPERRTR